jgi:anthranilate phosphoribosyltransferase
MEEAGICFMFAPVFHPAMKHAMGPRREMGVRTFFNILGPLTNPCDARGHVLGVYDADLTVLMAGVARRLGMERTFVVHGRDGQDEISTTGPTIVSELRDGEVSTYEIDPSDLGIPNAKPSDLVGGDAEVNSRILVDILSGRERGSRRDATVANAAAALAASGRYDGIADAVPGAIETIEDGSALNALIRFVTSTGGDPGRVNLILGDDA